MAAVERRTNTPLLIFRGTVNKTEDKDEYVISCSDANNGGREFTMTIHPTSRDLKPKRFSCYDWLAVNKLDKKDISGTVSFIVEGVGPIFKNLTLKYIDENGQSQIKRFSVDGDVTI